MGGGDGKSARKGARSPVRPEGYVDDRARRQRGAMKGAPMKNRTKICLVVLVVCLVVLALAAPMAEAKKKVIPPNATPFGATYADWSAKWWQWVFAIPQDENP
jgi:hypothetical protein